MGLKQLRSYAQLLVHSGLNIQPGQTVLIEVDVENEQFAKLVAEESYKAEAKQVVIRYTDAVLDKFKCEHQTVKQIREVEYWEREQLDRYVREGACSLLLTSSYLGLMDELDSEKATAYQQRSNELRNVIRHRIQTHHIQWCIAPVPNKYWAEVLFPKEDEKDAIEKFWKVLFKLMYMKKGEDPVENWNNHQLRIKTKRDWLNTLELKSLHFTNSIGTNLTIGLSDDHHWGGGIDEEEGTIAFSANMPTEEVFTSPDRFEVNGRVVSSRPLYLAGQIIDNFTLTFKDGEVVDVIAEKNLKVLKDLLLTDEGARYLGEVALVEHSSMISQSGMLFYNTLLDENAACHLALGKGFSGCVNGVNSVMDETWADHHLNVSGIHVDFMFGTYDMKVDAVTRSGSTIVLFENGNFAEAK